MTLFPQLRVRTGYSFRSAYGHLPDVFARLKEVEAPFAACVDWGTWGHARFEKAAEKAGIGAGFGMEVPICNDPESKFKPRAWMLAHDTRKFYANTSKVVQNGSVTSNDFSKFDGVYRFTGGAIDLLSHDDFDYIDLNPSSYVLAAKGLRLARGTGKPMVITSYNDMPTLDHADFAYAWEVRSSVGARQIESLDAIVRRLRLIGMTEAEIENAMLNTNFVASAVAATGKLAKAPLINVEGDMVALCRDGQQYRLAQGHIEQWTQEYEDRLKLEIEQIQLKQFDSYFLVVADLVQYAKQHMLVGPARGSSAGSLVCYLLGITEVDPIPHSLLFQRFIDVSRSDFPDIDIDFSDTKRHLVFEYLQNKYGSNHVAKLGNVNTLKAASVIAQVSKKFNLSFNDTNPVKNSLVEHMKGDARYGKELADTFEQTDAGRKFAQRNAEAANCMGNIEIHPSHAGVHAAGILVCNDPIEWYATVNEEGVAQVDKEDAEYLNLLKIDALGLRTLGIIESCDVVTANDLYSLKLNDPEVFTILAEDKMTGIFQFEGDALRRTAKSVEIDRFSKIDNLTALARPGPLSSGMSNRYIARAAGKEKVKYDIPQLETHLNETFGVLLYQEQVMSICRDIGKLDWTNTSEVRKGMAKSKGAEYLNKWRVMFVEGAASQGIAEGAANKLWDDMVAFGGYGFNKSHSVSYAIVTYWTCWLKRYHKLDFAAACLREAKDDEQTIAILRELAKEGVEYTALDPDHSDVNWKAVDGRLLGGVMNAKGYGPAKAIGYVQKRAAGELTEKDRARMAKAEVLYADLQEAHTKYGHFYRNPRAAGVTSGNPIVGMRSVKDRDEALVIGKLVKKALLDENSSDRVKKRGGKPYKSSQSQFIDLYCVDDSTDTAIRFRIRPETYLSIGKVVLDAPTGSWFLIKAWKLSDIDMMIVKNIKRLDNVQPELPANEEDLESERA